MSQRGKRINRQHSHQQPQDNEQQVHAPSPPIKRRKGRPPNNLKNINSSSSNKPINMKSIQEADMMMKIMPVNNSCNNCGATAQCNCAYNNNSSNSNKLVNNKIPYKTTATNTNKIAVEHIKCSNNISDKSYKAHHRVRSHHHQHHHQLQHQHHQQQQHKTNENIVAVNVDIKNHDKQQQQQQQNRHNSNNNNNNNNNSQSSNEHAQKDILKDNVSRRRLSSHNHMQSKKIKEKDKDKEKESVEKKKDKDKDKGKEKEKDKELVEQHSSSRHHHKKKDKKKSSSSTHRTKSEHKHEHNSGNKKRSHSSDKKQLEQSQLQQQQQQQQQKQQHLMKFKEKLVVNQHERATVNNNNYKAINGMLKLQEHMDFKPPFNIASAIDKEKPSTSRAAAANININASASASARASAIINKLSNIEILPTTMTSIAATTTAIATTTTTVAATAAITTTTTTTTNSVATTTTVVATSIATTSIGTTTTTTTTTATTISHAIQRTMWQARSVADIKMSSIYNRNSAEAPAELYRKDLISAMKLPDSEQLAVSEYLIVSDQWKQEWERGVQVPVNPDSLPEPCVYVLANPLVPGQRDFKLPKHRFLRITKDEKFHPDHHLLSNVPNQAEQSCAYDIDQMDMAWLILHNIDRAQNSATPINETQFEKIFEELEVSLIHTPIQWNLFNS